MATGQTIELAASEAVMRELERALAASPRKAQRAAERTLKRTIRSGKAAASKEIRRTIRLKKKTVDEQIGTFYRRSNLTGYVLIRDRRINLVEFLTPAQIASAYRAQLPKKSGTKGRAGSRSEGLAVKAYKDKPRRTYPGVFLNIMPSGKWLAIRRKTKDRYPTVGVGVRMTKNFEKGLGAFAAKQNEVLEKNLLSNLRFVIGELSG